MWVDSSTYSNLEEFCFALGSQLWGVKLNLDSFSWFFPNEICPFEVSNLNYVLLKGLDFLLSLSVMGICFSFIPEKELDVPVWKSLF